MFGEYEKEINLVIHAAAQPSHDWAAKDPIKDFSVNANGTLVVLEMVRKFCPEAVFIHLSTNKVYGDIANTLPLEELETRWELNQGHRFFNILLRKLFDGNFLLHLECPQAFRFRSHAGSISVSI